MIGLVEWFLIWCVVMVKVICFLWGDWGDIRNVCCFVGVGYWVGGFWCWWVDDDVRVLIVD